VGFTHLLVLPNSAKELNGGIILPWSTKVPLL
jgi:hypothetical protein